MTKANFPRKTEIAAWWIVIYGIVTTIVQISFLSILPAWSDSAEWGPGRVIFTFILLAIGIFYILPIRLLFRKERRAWSLAVLSISIDILALFVTAWIISYFYLDNGHSSVLLLIPLWILGLVPLILIILDRKNYFEIVHQREAEKKRDE